jgi:hypothetical protein
VIVGGDDRWTGNLFVGGDPEAAYPAAAEGEGAAVAGTAGYDGFPASFEEYLARIEAQPPGDHQRFLGMKQAVYAWQNVYAAGAQPFAGERDPVTLGAATATVTEVDGAVYLVTELPEGFDGLRVGVLGGGDLPRVRFADADFEERDGTPAVMAVDLLGEDRTTGAAGPVAALRAGSSRIRVW